MSKRKETNAIVIHCSATKPSKDIGANEIRVWHKARGWSDIGYHFVIRRSGHIEIGRPMDEQGAHVAGRNHDTIAICLIGGLFEDGSEGKKDTDFFELYSFAQFNALVDLISVFMRIYPEAKIIGHRDLSPDTNKDGKITPNEWLKSCPGFDVKEYFGA